MAVNWYNNNKADRRAGIKGNHLDFLRANVETWRAVGVRDDPRLERDNSRDARPVGVFRETTWGDVMRSTRKRKR